MNDEQLVDLAHDDIEFPQELSGREAVAIKQKFGGKCTKCGRALKRVFLVNGVAYGPICVLKIALQIQSETGRTRKHKTTVQPVEQTELEKFLDDETI